MQDAEVPSPWKVIVCPLKIKKVINEFLENNIKPFIGGDERGRELYRKYKEDVDNRKREIKEKIKFDRKSMSYKELANYDKNLWNELEESYCLTLQRFLLEPELFVEMHRDISSRHWVALLKRWKPLRELYENA